MLYAVLQQLQMNVCEDLVRLNLEQNQRMTVSEFSLKAAALSILFALPCVVQYVVVASVDVYGAGSLTYVLYVDQKCKANTSKRD